MIETLSTEDVLLIHEILVRDFATSRDPISPPGVRDLGLLESAVSRQHVSFGGQQKYRTPVESAATLTFGICNNHPFHNGNKRTALVALLAHLDKNSLTLMGTRQKDLYGMIMALATHSISALSSPAARKPRGRKGKKGQKATSGHRQHADAEVKALAAWIGGRAKKPRRGEKQITYRELSRILRRFGYELRVPKSGRGNHRDVVRVEEQTVGVIRKRQQVRKKRIGTIGYRDEGTVVVISDLKKIRELCRLREEDGVHSEAFYDAEAILDGFVNQYRGILNRLAKK